MYPSRVRTCRWRLTEYTKRVYLFAKRNEDQEDRELEGRDEDRTSEVVISTRTQR